MYLGPFRVPLFPVSLFVLRRSLLDTGKINRDETAESNYISDIAFTTREAGL